MDPIELVWPLSLNGAGGFTTTTDPAVSLRKHILAVLSTEQGERVMRPEYGAGVSRYMFESLDDPEAEALRESVLDALSTLVTEVTVEDVVVELDESTSRFLVSVRYRLANGVEGTAVVNVGETQS